MTSGLSVHNIAYRDTSGRRHELRRDAQGIRRLRPAPLLHVDQGPLREPPRGIL